MCQSFVQTTGCNHSCQSMQLLQQRDNQPSMIRLATCQLHTEGTSSFQHDPRTCLLHTTNSCRRPQLTDTFRVGIQSMRPQSRHLQSRGNMGELSEFWEFLKSLNFGRLETVEFRPETLEFRSDISNLGTFLEHFWQSWNFGPFGVSSSSQQRIWYKFESYPYEKTTPDAGDGWARISLFKF